MYYEMEVFLEEFNDAIVEYVHAHIQFVEAGEDSYIIVLDKPYTSQLCSPQLPCTRLWSKKFCGIVWANAVVCKSSPSIENLKKKLYEIPEVRNNIRECVRAGPLFKHLVSYKSPWFTPFVQHTLRLVTRFPHLPMNSLKIIYHRAHFLVKPHDEQTHIEQLSKWEEMVCIEQTSDMWEEWEMDDVEFTSLIQWLPWEMIEEVSLLEGKGYFP
jgi:hypothetical protein